jgi:hypothetical protein
MEAYELGFIENYFTPEEKRLRLYWAEKEPNSSNWRLVCPLIETNKFEYLSIMTQRWEENLCKCIDENCTRKGIFMRGYKKIKISMCTCFASKFI